MQVNVEPADIERIVCGLELYAKKIARVLPAEAKGIADVGELRAYLLAQLERFRELTSPEGTNGAAHDTAP